MKPQLDLNEGSIIEDCEFYERWKWNDKKKDWDVTQVRLIAYANGPATLLICDTRGGKIVECPRSELIPLPDETP